MKFLKIFTDARLYLFLSGLCLSVTAGYYSIVGLMAIFSGAAIPILIMGGSLEFAKVVSATWLYKSREQIPLFMKTYMTIAVIVLMFITSMGIFGFLSKAHLENAAGRGADVAAEYQSLKSEVDNDTKIISDIDKQLNLLDNTVKEDYNILRRQNKLRTQLTEDRKEATKRLRENNKKLAQANLEVQKVEVEVGPLKYIAQLIYGENAKDHLDSAVRIVILMLVFVFDPLALMLLIAASRKPVMKSSIVEREDGLFLNKNDILDLEKINER
jgi:hypothetical protein